MITEDQIIFDSKHSKKVAIGSRRFRQKRFFVINNIKKVNLCP